MLVSGPVATRVTAPGAAEISPMRKSTACASTARRRGAGSLAAPRPDSPCTSRASWNGRSSGAGLPAATGTPGRPRNSSTASALAVVRSRPTLPATVVTPHSSRPGCPQAKAIANASSMPGSQSRMTFLGTVPAGPLTLPDCIAGAGPPAVRAGRQGSAGGVQPADRRAVGGAPERFKLAVPRLAEQPGKLLGQRVRGVLPLGTALPEPRDAGRGGRHRQRRPEPVLRHQDV